MMPLLTAFILLYGVNIILTFDLFYIEFRIILRSIGVNQKIKKVHMTTRVGLFYRLIIILLW